MNKIFTLTCIVLFCTVSIHSQNRKEGREKIKALKVAYLTDQLNLTTSEAEKFWPVYNAYNKQQNKIRSNYKSNLRKNTSKEKGGVDNLSDEEAKKLISLKLLTDKELYESEKNFISEIKQIMSYSKILKLQIAEKEFGRKLMRKYRHKKTEKKN